jgi:hypothetical protein
MGVDEGLEGRGMMTRQEQAYVKRLKKRIRDLYMGYCVIKTWLSMPKDDEETIYHIASLCTEKILNEKAAMKKEGEEL